MLHIIGTILIVFGLSLIGLGIWGLFRFKHFYTRALIASLVDTAGYIALLVGIILRNGINFFSMKVLLILLLTIIINPLVTHAIIRSAFISGYKIGKE